MRRNARALILILVLVVSSVLILGFQKFSIGNFERGDDTILGLSLGLDLQGGSHLVYQAALTDPDTGEPVQPTSDQMAALKKTIERRVNASGLGEPIIQLLGEDRLLIQLPGVSNLDRAKELIGETARLEFKHRIVEVERDIPGVSSEDVVNAEIAVLAPGSTTTDPTLATVIASTDTTTLPPTPTTSTATTTIPSFENSKGFPVLVLELAQQAADAFGELLGRLDASLEPLGGSGDVYPSYLNLSAQGDTDPALRIAFNPILALPGQVLPLSNIPNMVRIEGTNRFAISLAGAAIAAVTDPVLARDRFLDESALRLSEVQGRVDEDTGLTGDDLERAYDGQHAQTGLPIVNIEFNPEGSRKFGELTAEIAGSSDLLAIILDDEELIAPSVRQAITGGTAFIEGRDFTLERVRDISLLLESGRLPIPVQLIQERSVDAILGADSLEKSVIAGIAGLILVLVFMLLYYRIPGLVAAAALIIYATMVLAIFKMVPVTLTLSGIAAAILSIGMAVDANILIFERMKDELRAGRTLLSSINIGFNRAWPAIRDGNVSTLITCAILFWFADTLGATVVQGFAITLAIGVSVSMFSAITISRTFLRLLVGSPLASQLGLYVPAGGKYLPQNQPESSTA